MVHLGITTYTLKYYTELAADIERNPDTEMLWMAGRGGWTACLEKLHSSQRIDKQGGGISSEERKTHQVDWMTYTNEYTLLMFRKKE